jgi:mono/diheme cytochrome c family protein
MNRKHLLFALTATITIQAACDGDDAGPRTGEFAAEPEAKPAPLAGAAKAERGRYLVNAGACNDCHTPWKMGPNGPEPDMSRQLSGHPAGFEMPPPPPASGPWIGAIGATNTAWAGPWGVSFTANLTPDPKTGIGTWTEQNFIDTIRNGRHMGVGRPLLPPMPAPMYAKLTDEDLGSIFAYLRTIPAVDNKVPAPRPPVTAALAPATTSIATRN